MEHCGFGSGKNDTQYIALAIICPNPAGSCVSEKRKKGWDFEVTRSLSMSKIPQLR